MNVVPLVLHTRSAHASCLFPKVHRWNAFLIFRAKILTHGICQELTRVISYYVKGSFGMFTLRYISYISFKHHNARE